MIISYFVMTPKFSVNYQMIEPLDFEKMKTQYEPDAEDLESGYNPFIMHNFQYYQPLYKVFFNMDDTNYNSICLNHKYKMIDLCHVKTDEGSILEKSIFIKYSPMLDPLHYMVGKYDLEDPTLKVLPTLKGNNKTKIESVNNSSNVDCFFSFISSIMLNHHNFLNCMDFYGSYLCIQDQAKINITDDYEYLCDSEFFIENMNKKWKISKYEFIRKFMNMDGSRSNKQTIQINESLNLDDMLDCEQLDVSESAQQEQLNMEELNDTDLHEEFVDSEESVDMAEDMDLNTHSDESDSEVEETSDEESNSESGSEESDDDEETEMELHAYIKDFPVQMICLEKCDGTFDSLLESSDLSLDEASSALIQIVMTLLCFQKVFKFTHNDLHTNNIMYVNTEIEYLFYRYKNQVYRVPTHGRIYKIIDFGRAIYKFKNKIYCSDSFAPGGDAATQYNCEPFYNDKKPIIEPNMSFDLCRLGCSIYDFIIDDEDESEMDEFQKTVHRWCQDDNDLNVLYKSSGSERYPNFKLYKMIARTVHNHTPENQLKYEFFSQYAVAEDLVDSPQLMDIDILPSYYDKH